MIKLLAAVSLLLLGACAPTSTGDPEIPCDIPATGLPDDLFCTGLYAHRDRATIASDVMPYTPGATFWSDGAEKHRFLLLPADSQIDTSDLDSWQFPIGTKTWKDFRVDGKLVETRHMWKRDDGAWAVGTYIWNDDETEATLNTATKGTRLGNGYEIPTQKDCDKCHHGGSDQVLGIEAVALGLRTAEGETLDALARDGFLSHPPLHTQVELPNDATGEAAYAAAFLHVNCGMACHSTRGIGQETELVLRLRASELWPLGADGETPALDVTRTDIWRATFEKDPTTASVAQHFPGAKRILPGDHEHSLVWLMSNIRDNYQMPPLVTHKVDEEGMQKLADWIDALPAPSPSSSSTSP